MGHRSELDRLRQQRDELASMLGQHRQTVRPQQDWSSHPSCCCFLLPCHSAATGGHTPVRLRTT
jgi:hypothetical protein